MNIFPLGADVWGTVSDWFMVFVTSVTGYLIWKTLKSQTKVQIDQHFITKIEVHKHQLDVRPEFTLSVNEFKKSEDDTSVYLEEVVFTLKLNNNIAYRINSSCVNEFSNTNNWIIVPDPNSLNFLNANDSITLFGKCVS